MDHTWAANAVGTAPTKPTTLQLGYPTDTATPTIPGAYWFYQMTEEIRNVVVNVLGAGAPDAGNVSQLYSSIITLFNQATYTPTFINNSSGPSAIGIVASLERIPFGGAAQNGMAGELMFTMQDAGGNLINTNAIRSQWTDVTVGNRKSSLIFSSGSGNSLTDSMVLDSTGKLFVNNALVVAGALSTVGSNTMAYDAYSRISFAPALGGSTSDAVISQSTTSPRDGANLRLNVSGAGANGAPYVKLSVNDVTYATVSTTGLSVAGSVIVSTGLNVAGNGGFYNSANKFGLDNVAGLTRMYSSGANSSSRGSYDFRVTDSVGTLDMSAMTLSATGASVTGAFTAAGAKFGGSTYSPFGVSFLHDYNVGWTNSADTGIGPYLNSDGTSLFVYTNNIKRITVDSNGNIGHGISTSAWGQGKAIDLLGGSLWSTANGPYLNQNAYFGAASWYYINPGAASQYYQSAGLHVWSVAAYSATAGSPCTFTPVATLSNTGLAVSGVVSANNLLISGVNGATIGFGDVSAAIQVFNGSSASPNHIDFYTSTNKVTTIDSLGNLLIGVSTTSMQDGGKIVLGNNKSISHAGPISYFDTNIYYNGGDRYVSTGYATRQSSINGTITWSTYALGAAGASLGSASTMVLGTSGGVTLTNAEASITLNTTGQNAYSLISGGNGNLTNGFFGIRNNTAGTVPFTIAANSPANSVGITSAGLSVNGAITATAGITTTSLTTNGFSSTAGITNTSAANTNSTITLSGSGAYSSIINLNSAGGGAGAINTSTALFVAINGSNITTVTSSGLTVAGALSTTSNITLNNATYFQTKNTGGTTGRLLGINSGNTVYVGDIDSIGNGTVNVVAGGVATINITASGASVSGTLSATGVVSGASASFTGNVSIGGNISGAGLTINNGGVSGAKLFKFIGSATLYGYSDSGGVGIATSDPYTSGSMYYMQSNAHNWYIGATNTMSLTAGVLSVATTSGLSTNGVSSAATITVTAGESLRLQNDNSYISFFKNDHQTRNGYIQHTGSNLIITSEVAGGVTIANGGTSLTVSSTGVNANSAVAVAGALSATGQVSLGDQSVGGRFYSDTGAGGRAIIYGLASVTTQVNNAVITQATAAGLTVTGAISGSYIYGTAINIAGHGIGADPYGVASVTCPGDTNNYSYYGLTRAGNMGAGFGLTGAANTLGLGANSFAFGSATSESGTGLIGGPWIAFNSTSFNTAGAIVGGGNISASGSVSGASASFTGNVFSGGSTEAQIGAILTGYNPVYLYSNTSGWGVYSGTGGSAFAYSRSTGLFTFNGASTSSPAGSLTGTALAANVTSSSLTSVGTLLNLTVTNTISGNISGTAATLATARTINGTSFDGSANVTVTAAAGTLTGITLNSTVTASSLTSVGTLTNLSVVGAIAATGSYSSTNNSGNFTMTPTVTTSGTYLSANTGGGIYYFGTENISASLFSATAYDLVIQTPASRGISLMVAANTIGRITSAGTVLTGTLGVVKATAGDAITWNSVGNKTGYLFSNSNSVGFYDTAVGGGAGVYAYQGSNVYTQIAGINVTSVNANGLYVVGTLGASGTTGTISTDTTGTYINFNYSGTNYIRASATNGAFRFQVNNSTTMMDMSSNGVSIYGTLSASGVTTLTDNVIFNKSLSTLLYRGDTVGYLGISGGVSSTDGFNLILGGSTTSTYANKASLRSGATEVLGATSSGVTVATQAIGDSSTYVATTAFVHNVVTAIPHGITVLTTSTTFTVPAGVSMLKVTVMAAGGAGSGLGYSNTGVYGAARGGNGGICSALIAVTPGQTIACTVPGKTPKGTSGGSASFGSYITCTGGQVGGGGVIAGANGSYSFSGITMLIWAGVCGAGASIIDGPTPVGGVYPKITAVILGSSDGYSGSPGGSGGLASDGTPGGGGGGAGFGGGGGGGGGATGQYGYASGGGGGYGSGVGGITFASVQPNGLAAAVIGAAPCIGGTTSEGTTGDYSTFGGAGGWGGSSYYGARAIGGDGGDSGKDGYHGGGLQIGGGGGGGGGGIVIEY